MTLFSEYSALENTKLFWSNKVLKDVKYNIQVVGFDFSISQRPNAHHYCPEPYFEIGIITPGLKRVTTYIYEFIILSVPNNAFKEEKMWCSGAQVTR